MTESSNPRTIVEFKDRRTDQILRTQPIDVEIPNVKVGNRLAFDHPQLDKCLSGIVTNVQHVIFLDEPPITYVDVEVK